MPDNTQKQITISGKKGDTILVESSTPAYQPTVIKIKNFEEYKKWFGIPDEVILRRQKENEKKKKDTKKLRSLFGSNQILFDAQFKTIDMIDKTTLAAYNLYLADTNIPVWLIDKIEGDDFEVRFRDKINRILIRDLRANKLKITLDNHWYFISFFGDKIRAIDNVIINHNGADGTAANNRGDAGDGDDGKDGRDKNGAFDGEARNGERGENGDNGSNASRGGDGEKPELLSLDLTLYNGKNVTINARGGNGGKGGNGGDGGDGGNGGDGGDNLWCGAAGKGGRAGNGGNGGKGGEGGDGGDGGDVVIHSDADNTVLSLEVNNEGGRGGEGGKGGDHGSKGGRGSGGKSVCFLSTSHADDGSRGSNGSDGADGDPGESGRSGFSDNG